MTTMNPITICPSTLSEGYDTYSPVASRRLFDGRTVSPYLDYAPIDDDSQLRQRALGNLQHLATLLDCIADSHYKIPL